MDSYTYSWLHIPSGKKGTNTVRCVSVNDFISKINKWNSSQPGVWQYYATIWVGLKIN